MFRSRISILTLITTALIAGRPASALSLANFRTCVSSSGGSYGSVCALDYTSTDGNSIHRVDSTLYVGRSNITIQGTASGGQYPTLKRWRIGYGDGPQQILQFTYGVSNVTLQNLNFDGAYGDTASPPSTCNPCAGTCGFWADVWAVGGTNHITFQYLRFDNASENGIILNGTNHYVYQVTMNHGRNAGILIGGASNIQIYSSTFQSNFGAGVAISGGNNSAITIGAPYVGNGFYHNHWGQPDCSNGGQVYVGGVSTNVSVAGNVIDGQHVWSDPGQQAGVEVDPNVSSLTLSGNVVTGNGAEGEGFKWNVSSTQVNGDSVYSNGSAGFYFLGQDGHGAVSDPGVSLKNVTASGNPIDVHLWGFRSNNKICSTNYGMTVNNENSGGFSPYYNQATCP